MMIFKYLLLVAGMIGFTGLLVGYMKLWDLFERKWPNVYYWTYVVLGVVFFTTLSFDAFSSFEMENLSTVEFTAFFVVVGLPMVHGAVWRDLREKYDDDNAP